MVTFSLSQRPWMLVLVLLGAGLGACGGREAAESGEPAPAATEAPLTNPCRSDLVALGYEFDSPASYPGDFEDGRAPGFYVSIDRSPGSVVTTGDGLPITGGGTDRVIPTEQARSCLHEDGTEGTEGTYALRIQGTDLRDWGISITQDYFQADHDAGQWDGVSFWVRRGSAEVGRTMFAGVMDWHTKEVAWNPEAVADPPYNFFCGDIASRPDLKCDRFGVGVGLDEGWRFVAIPFSSMRQQGYGPAALCLYTQGLKGLSFTLAAGNWDFWIDDIAFYRAPPQERPPPVECDDAAPLSAP